MNAIFLLYGLFFVLIPFVPGIVFIATALIIRKRSKYKKLPIILALIGVLLISAYSAEQWLNPRIESAHAISVFDGSLVVVNNSAFHLSNFDVDDNLVWEKGALINLVYQTNILGYKQSIQIDQMNPLQQISDLKYNVGSPESTYNDCLEGDSPLPCYRIGTIQGNPIFFSPASGDEKTAFAYTKINNNIIAIADDGSIEGGSSNIISSEAKTLIFSLKPMTKDWEIRTLIFHYNGGVFVLGRPGNSIIPLPA